MSRALGRGSNICKDFTTRSVIVESIPNDGVDLLEQLVYTWIPVLPRVHQVSVVEGLHDGADVSPFKQARAGRDQ
jgi:hypothetical protein